MIRKSLFIALGFVMLLGTGFHAPQTSAKAVAGTVALLETFAPSAPLNLNAVPDDGKVKLSWDAVTGADSYAVYKYEGWPAPADTGAWEPVSGELTATSFTVPGLTNGTTYCFAVKAVNEEGESDFSLPTSMSPYAPPVLSISISHSGIFKTGEDGTYAVTVTNVGRGATIGKGGPIAVNDVTVAVSLPPQMTIVSMFGTGWSCLEETLTCTRMDLLSSGAAYPHLMITVHVAADAPATLTNTASVSGGGDEIGSTASDVTIIARPTVTVLSISPAGASVYGQEAILTADVSLAASTPEVPTGSVTFKDGATELGTVALDASGRAVLNDSKLPVGSHVLTAEYHGDSPYISSSSPDSYHAVLKAETSTIVSSSLNPSKYGDNGKLEVTVVQAGTGNATPTGSVILKAGSTTIGTASLDSGGKAEFSDLALPVGSHTFTADYPGGANFNPSTSPAFTQVVERGETQVAFTIAPSPSTIGQPVTFTVTVSASAGSPTGNVTFKDGTTVWGTIPLDSIGKAQFTTSELGTGTYRVTAQYEGDADYGPSSSALTLSVNALPTETALTSTKSSTAFGETVAFTASVTDADGGAIPSGTVTFLDGATEIGTGTLDEDGFVTLQTDELEAGTHMITATYNGGDVYATSVSDTWTQVVQKAETTVTVTPIPASEYGQRVTLRAAVTANAPGNGTPTGIVTFREGSSVRGTAALGSDGIASVDMDDLEAGTHTIDVEFNGSSNYKESTAAVPLTVQIERAATAATLTSSVSSAVFGQPITLTATVNSGGVPTGTITFKQGAVVLGTAALNASGQASFTLAPGIVPVGNHSVTALYNGDSNYRASVSSPLAIEVAKGATRVQLQSVARVANDQPFTVEAAVQVAAPGAGLPTGTVSLASESDALGSAAVGADSKASIVVGPLPVGDYTITGTYSGDASFDRSKATASVRVYDPASVELRLDTNAYHLRIGDNHSTAATLEYGPADHQDVTLASRYSSSDASVATVDPRGVVTGVGAGTAQITVTFENYTTKAMVTVDRQTPTYSDSGFHPIPAPQSPDDSWLLPRSGKLVGVKTEVSESGGIQVIKVLEREVREQLKQGNEARLFVVSATGSSRYRIEMSAALAGEIGANHALNKLGVQLDGASLELHPRMFAPQAIAALHGISSEEAAGAMLTVEIEIRTDISVPDAVITPLRLAVKAKTGSKTVSLDSLGGQFARMAFVLSDTADLTTIAGVAVRQEGKAYPVPTIARESGGKKVVIMQTHALGTFAAVSHFAALSDIHQSWAKEAIQAMGNRLVIGGFPDGSFRPDANVTRAEFASILTRALGLPVLARQSAPFSDVGDGDWFSGYIVPLYDAGLITGYEDGTFRGDNEITREEAVSIFMRAAEYVQSVDKQDLTGEAMKSFSDKSQISGYAMTSIETASRIGLTAGYEDGTFRPRTSATRAEVVVIMNRLLRFLGLAE